MQRFSGFRNILLIACFVFNSCGVGCVQSRKEIVAEKEKVYQAEQIIPLDVKEGGEYVVKDIVDLRGANAIIPPNVMISFKKGGCVVNGTLTGNNTVMSLEDESILGVKLKGTWRVNRIRDLSFIPDYLSDDDIINNINILQSDDLKNEVIINRDYTVTIPRSGGSGLKLASNTTCYLNATLTVAPNDFKSYNIVQIKQKKNIKIKGGRIVGDVGLHTYVEGSTSEWGVGVDIEESQDVILEDLYITKCCGDGIYISGGNESSVGVYNHASKNVTIRNVTSDDNRRQGLSVIHVDGLIVSDCAFVNTGQTEYTAPAAGIDIEPNVTNGRNMSVRNVVIKDCSIKNNKGMAISNSPTIFMNGRVNHENIVYKNCETDGLLQCASTDVTFSNCSFKEVLISSVYTPSTLFFNNCIISGGYGIMINTPNSSGVQSKDRMLSLYFKGCTLSSNEQVTETNSLISLKDSYHVKNVKSVVFEDCHLEIPKAKSSTYTLTSDSFNNKLVIRSSEILMPGRVFDAEGVLTVNNTIICGKKKRHLALSKDRVIEDN